MASGNNGEKREAHRKGDLGGPVTSPVEAIGGSPDIFINGRPAMRVGDVYEDGSLLIEGSRSVFFNGKPASRILDAINNGGTALTGSPNVFIGDEGIPSSRQDEASPCQDAQKKVMQEVEQIKNAYDHDVEKTGRGYAPFSKPPLTELGNNSLMPSQYIEINRAITSAYGKMIADAPSLPWARVGHVVAAQFGCNMRGMHAIANRFDDMIRAIGEGNIRIFEGLYPTMRLVADLGAEKFLDCAQNGHFDIPVPEDLIAAIEKMQEGNFAEVEEMIVKYEQTKIAPPIYRQFRPQYEALQSLAAIIKKHSAGLWDMQSVLPLTQCAFPPGTSWQGIAPVSMDGSLFNENDRIEFYHKLAPHIYKHYGQ